MATTQDVFYVGELDGGQFVALRETEPVFCFVRDTREEAIAVAKETWSDYRKRFLRMDEVVSVREMTEIPVHLLREQRAYALEVA